VVLLMRRAYRASHLQTSTRRQDLNMNNLKISTRLMALLGLLSLLLLVVGGMGLFGIVKADDALETVYKDRVVPLQQLAEISRLMQRNELALANSVVFPDEAHKDTAEVEANSAKITEC
jgi:methyl-accepting chemotaxis protein-1 (serine sensor receptor)